MDSSLRALVDLRDRTLQKSRIAFGNRLNAITSGTDEWDAGSMEIAGKWHLRFQELEEEAEKDIKRLAGEYPIIEQMVHVRGVGKLLAAKLVALIDISKAPTISALWRYCGLAVIDGQRERPTKGVKLSYNARAKTTMYLIAGSMLKTGSPYREIYDEARAYYAVNRTDWTAGHQHLAALRKMEKVFLSHLWLRWRELEGLPASQPWIMNEPHHTHYISPEDMGWPTAKDSEHPD